MGCMLSARVVFVFRAQPGAARRPTGQCRHTLEALTGQSDRPGLDAGPHFEVHVADDDSNSWIQLLMLPQMVLDAPP